MFYYYEFGLNSYRKMNIKDLPHINSLGIFDLEIR